ncbi:hypothetical protein [Metabacillus niabensis]|uniref:Cobalamin biosynthesis protein CobT n=1 Tax=Metabacillus niabensis TaxID=324854 RepID=A0ABT9YX51_9BACI|nr:hypothetical protein [Metabacillus niabensis]MDQ0223893.1 cobalamin biosynthesis protein CobT [Metabacillus niabensis]
MAKGIKKFELKVEFHEEVGLSEGVSAEEALRFLLDALEEDNLFAGSNVSLEIDGEKVEVEYESDDAEEDEEDKVDDDVEVEENEEEDDLEQEVNEGLEEDSEEAEASTGERVNSLRKQLINRLREDSF